MNKFIVYLLRVLLLILIGGFAYFVISTMVDGFLSTMNTRTTSEITESSCEDTPY